MAGRLGVPVINGEGCAVGEDELLHAATITTMTRTEALMCRLNAGPDCQLRRRQGSQSCGCCPQHLEDLIAVLAEFRLSHSRHPQQLSQARRSCGCDCHQRLVVEHDVGRYAGGPSSFEPPMSQSIKRLDRGVPGPLPRR